MVKDVSQSQVVGLWSKSVHQHLHLYQARTRVPRHTVRYQPCKGDQRPGLATEQLSILWKKRSSLDLALSSKFSGSTLFKAYVILAHFGTMGVGVGGGGGGEEGEGRG